MKLFLLIIFPFFSAPARDNAVNVHVYWTNDSGVPSRNVIYYDVARPLAWPDFKGAPGPASAMAAITTSGFGYRANMHSESGNETIDVAVYCFFSEDRSWVRPGKSTSYILNHEQHHFDASYLAANMFMSRVKAASFTMANSKEVLARIYAECCAALNKMQDDYDGQTNNGLIEESQQHWNDFFTGRLHALTS